MMNILCFLTFLLIICSTRITGNDQFFPHDPNVQDSNPMYDNKHRIVMGIPNVDCDDAQTNINVDWDSNPMDYFCSEDKTNYLPKSSVKPLHTWDYIPTEYSAPHICMNETIKYEDRIPTFGPHRPLWALYGEYVYLPPQRWVHNLEHGAVVMLYHPCALPDEVNRLKRLVRSCLYRHVITPFKGLTPERPLALVTWAHRLEMSKVSNKVVYKFIQKHALRGPEQVAADGQYDYMFDIQAEIVSDENDTRLCPHLNDKIINDIHMKK